MATECFMILYQIVQEYNAKLKILAFGLGFAIPQEYLFSAVINSCNKHLFSIINSQQINNL